MDRRLVKWLPPSGDFIKFNFDGASHGNPGPSSIGGVFRNTKGVILKAFSGKISDGTNNQAETLALVEGFRVAISLKFSHLHIEGDSLIIINSLKKHHTFNWQLDYLLQEAWHLLDAFDSYIISHTLREGNRLADAIANLGFDLDSSLSYFDEDLIGQYPHLADIVHLDCLRYVK